MEICIETGLIWADMKSLYDKGFEEYTCNMWNLLDFTTNFLYLATITLRVLAYSKVRGENSLNIYLFFVRALFVQRQMRRNF